MLLENFQYMKDIFFDSFEQFSKDVNVARDQMLLVDYDNIEKTPEIIDLNTAEKIPDGRWNTEFKDINFECFFHYKETKILYVFLNGAISGKQISAPRFSRWSYYKFINGSMLNISDPMYRIFGQLKLGWYYGNAEMNLHQILADLVMRIADIIGVESRNIVFVGSSGGGYASIACAGYVPYAKSIAINPQLVLKEWSYSTEFMKITGMNLMTHDRWHRNNAIYYLQHNRKTKHILFINLRSRQDMNQVGNICTDMGIRVKYGLNIFENLIIWLYDADMTPWINAHSLQENYCIWFMLEFIIDNCDDKEKLIEHEALFNLINEFYYGWKKGEKNWRGKIQNIEILWKCGHTNRKVAIFGLGEYADFLNKELFDIEGRNYYQIQIILDNDMRKRGFYYGLPIVHPSDISEWEDLFVIIASEKYDDEIAKQLERLGLVYEKDYIIYKDLYNH